MTVEDGGIIGTVERVWGPRVKYRVTKDGNRGLGQKGDKGLEKCFTNVAKL